MQEARKRIAHEPENEDSATSKASQPEGGFMRIDREAEFPGGNVALSRFLQVNLRYPDTAGNHNIQGTVLVQFAVNKDGSIGEVEVIHGIELGYDLPKEAVRVISIMPKWIPAQKGGNNIKSYKKLPIVFRLTAESVKP
jgi:protein TonB